MNKLNVFGLAVLASLPGVTAWAQTTLTEDQARAAIAPFYAAFNVAPGKDAGALILQASAPDWQSCGGNEACHPREDVAATVAGFGKVIPNLTWVIKEVLVSGNRVIVRGEGRGTPVAPFLGVPPSGRTFQLMSIDVHTIVGGKLSGKSYHLEDWAGASRQLSGR